MSNFNYTNIDSILLATNPIRGSRTRLSSVRRKLVVPALSDSEEQYFGRESSLELHVFLPNTTYVDNSSLYDVPFKIESRTERVTSGGVTETVDRNASNSMAPTGSVKFFLSEVSQQTMTAMNKAAPMFMNHAKSALVGHGKIVLGARPTW